MFRDWPLKIFRPAFRALTGRDVFVFTRVGSFEHSPPLPLKYSYRAQTDGVVEYRLGAGGNNFSYQLFNEGKLAEPVLSLHVPQVAEGDHLRVNIATRQATLNGREIAIQKGREADSRKFLAQLRLQSAQGPMHYQCPHYIPWDGKEVGREYYHGEDYKDYIPAAEADSASKIALIKKYRQSGRLLDVGCALGVYTKAFQGAGFDAYGIDFSQYAIGEAAKRVGESRAKQCDLDVQPIPFGGQFDIFYAWDVLEHAGDPRGLIKKLTDAAAPGALLVMHTSNADSLTHKIRGGDWEGFSDYSHRGVTQVTANSVRQWLTDLGWNIVSWKITGIWAPWTDPANARLSQAFTNIPELRAILEQLELGDFLFVVAELRK